MRAVLLPLGVATFLIAALSWYGLVWIPSQQRYLNERNIRLLRTMAAQIRSNVNNFDVAVDHALESFPFDDADSTSIKQLDQYVKLFAPELEILDKPNQPIVQDEAGEPIVLFDDPPRVLVRLDEGKNFVHLFYKHVVGRRGKSVSVSVSAKADIDRVVSDSLASRSEFDALGLVDRDGRVIAQRSSSGIELAWINRLTAETPTPQSRTMSQESASNAFATLRATGKIVDVTIGGADYKLFVQPVNLSLLAKSGKEAEEWALCGLVRSDHFRAASSAISSTYWLMLIAALALLCLVIPLLKLRVLGRRERFRGGDGVLVAATTFLIAALMTFCVLDVYYFSYAFRNVTDRQLRGAADEIRRSVIAEAEAAVAELDSRADTLYDDLTGLLKGEHAPETQVRFEKQKRGESEQRLGCDPVWACGQDLLLEKGALERPYPFFKVIAWSDSGGTQRAKRTTDKSITPFISIAALEYFGDLDRARRLEFDKGVPRHGVSVVQSPNTGAPLTVFWKALPDDGWSDLTAASLVTTPMSVVRPVLPKDLQFAVLDTTGRVLFHSDPRRSLNENFFQECEENPTLRALAAARTSGTSTVQYLGRRHRLHVTPIDLASSLNSFRDPQWSLVVFQDRLVFETINLETLTLATMLFVAYGLVLAAVWALVSHAWPGQCVKWFWPDDKKAAAYRRTVSVNAASSLAFAGLIAAASPGWLLFGAVTISACAVAATFAVVQLAQPTASSRGRWRNDFLLARVSLLFVIAAAPAIACFHVAYLFESRLLIRRGQLHLAGEIDARAMRAQEQAQQLQLCPAGTVSCANVETFISRRLADAQWDLHILPFARSPRAPADLPEHASRTDQLLSFAHLAYNDTATDLQTAFPTIRADGDTQPNWSWSTNASGESVFTKGTIVLASAAPSIDPGLWLVAAAVACGLFLVSRYAVQPLFLLDLYAPPGLECSGDREPIGNLLITGPPGSGKTEALRLQSRSRVFDVRTLAYLDAEAHAPELAFLGPMAPPDFSPRTGSRTAQAGSLVDAMALSTLPDGGVIGIDHLEYRLDDPSFRDGLLAALEELIYRRRYRVWIASTREPVEHWQESGAAVDLDRWHRLFESFRKQTVGIGRAADPTRLATMSTLIQAHGAASSGLEKLLLAECSLTPRLLSIGEAVIGELPAGIVPAREEVLFEIGVAAEPFYRSIWASCSKDEKLVLRQLAEEGVVNPRNPAIVARLLRSRLVRRDPTFRLMNETFRRFVLHELSPDRVAEWERDGVRLPWGSITTTMLTLAMALIGLLLLTQQQLVDAWVGFVPALAPAVPTVLKWMSAVRGSRTGAVTTLSSAFSDGAK